MNKVKEESRIALKIRTVRPLVEFTLKEANGLRMTLLGRFPQPA
jgi:hypothetical protein